MIGNKKYVFLAAAMLIGIVACSEEDMDKKGYDGPTENISFKLDTVSADIVSETRAAVITCQGDAASDVTMTVERTAWNDMPDLTRGTLAATSDITEFGVSGTSYLNNSAWSSGKFGNYFYNETAEPDVPMKYYWPTSAYKMAFFAYYPYDNDALQLITAQGKRGYPQYSYSVPSDITQQLDVMTTQSVDQTHNPVELTFQRRCSAICLNVVNNRSTPVKVQKVAIEGVKYTGTLQNVSWTLGSSVNSSTSNPFVLNTDVTVRAGNTTSITGTSKIFIMLPQYLNSTAKLKVTVDGLEYAVALNGTWQAGAKYTYSLVFSHSSEYFTTIARESTVFTLTIGANVAPANLPEISYSLDNGVTWVTTANVASEQVTIVTPTIRAGGKVLWKGNTPSSSGQMTNSSSVNRTNGRSVFSSTGQYDVMGNILSLIKGDSFATNTTLQGGYNFAYLFNNSTKLVSAEELVLPSLTLTQHCYKGMFQGCTALTKVPELPATTLAESCYESMFEGCSGLRDIDNELLPATTMQKNCYKNMFKSSGIRHKGTVIIGGGANPLMALPAMTLAEGCYEGMFSYCTGIISSLITLPATTLAKNCYREMFAYDTGMLLPPSISATTLAEGCCFNMFMECTELTRTPELAATTLAKQCYTQMFYGCTNLSAVSTLPAMTMADECYAAMFCNCTRLETAPALPATRLAWECYDEMFQGCVNLKAAPSLPAMTMAEECYQNMFNGCTRLTSVPTTLPATSLAEKCYFRMFQGCASLTKGPALPATTLAESCYAGMFNGCSSLIKAPELPATTLVENCYWIMFYECSNLNDIKAAFLTSPTDGFTANYTENWVYGVATTGTFYKNSAATWNATGVHAIPAGWTVQTYTP